MQANDIKLLHVESSSKCNAWCPACPRNNNGFGLADHVTEADLPVERFFQILEQLPNLEIVQLCGNHGDPVAGNNIMPIVDMCIDKKLKVQIHTNGSLRNTTWWSELGTKLKDVAHDVWFGIDGVGATHEIYRQGTDYDKIIENATAFINAGGQATWQFVPYEHNQHQVLQAIKISQQLKFKNFKLAKLFRKDKLESKHWKTGEPFELRVADKLVPLLRIDHKTQAPTVDKCMHLSIPSVYVDAHGRISWCCYRYSESQDTVQQVLNLTLDLNNNRCITQCS
jgi:organic radical activating enzyme